MQLKAFFFFFSFQCYGHGNRCILAAPRLGPGMLCCEDPFHPLGGSSVLSGSRGTSSVHPTFLLKGEAARESLQSNLFSAVFEAV